MFRTRTWVTWPWPDVRTCPNNHPTVHLPSACLQCVCFRKETPLCTTPARGRVTASFLCSWRRTLTRPSRTTWVGQQPRAGDWTTSRRHCFKIIMANLLVLSLSGADQVMNFRFLPLAWNCLLLLWPLLGQLLWWSPGVSTVYGDHPWGFRLVEGQFLWAYVKPSVTCLRVKRAIQIHFDLIWFWSCLMFLFAQNKETPLDIARRLDFKKIVAMLKKPQWRPPLVEDKGVAMATIGTYLHGCFYILYLYINVSNNWKEWHDAGINHEKRMFWRSESVMSKQWMFI